MDGRENSAGDYTVLQSSDKAVAGQAVLRIRKSSPDVFGAMSWQCRRWH